MLASQQEGKPLLLNHRTGALAGLVAAISMTASPAAAAELPKAQAPSSSIFTDFDQSAYDGDLDIAERHRWRRGYRGYRGYRRHRVDAGDVLAGVLILGGIAAVASAASNKNERRYRDRDYERRTRDYDRDYDRRDNPRSSGASGLDNAVDQCVSRIERDVRVESVDSVDRNADGWTVTGALYNGEGFTCRIDGNGRIADIDYGGFGGVSYDGADNSRARGDDAQWSDARYIAARQQAGVSQPDAATVIEDEPRPAYPGGPLPGEDTGEIDADLRG